MVEFELFQRCERIAHRRRPPQERPSDRDHDEHREDAAEHEREGHTGTAAYRSASFRCSTASGHMATREPNTKTKPAAQTRLTSGFTSTFRASVPFFEMP